jgi:4-coumarate--CoA ligase
MFHASSVPVAHTSALRGGQVSYIMRRFELEPFLFYAQKYAITELTVVPPLAIAIIMSPITKKYSLKSVKQAICGAAPLSKESQERLKQMLLAPGTPFNQVWGMTETSCVAMMFFPPESDDTGSIGRPTPNLDVKYVPNPLFIYSLSIALHHANNHRIIDDSGTDITAYDTPGELCVRGPIVICGYFDNPSANSESFDSDHYFRTGDIVYCSSASKKWYIVDRKKELIKVRGFQVAPPELEAVLLTHPQIVDAGVIGVNIGEAEVPRAYVVRRPGDEGARLTESEVREWCRKRLAGYKDLVGGVVFADSIPKNASGKILKRVLRDCAKKEMASEKARM